MNSVNMLMNPRETVYQILNEYFKRHCNLKDLINRYLDTSELTGLNKNFIYNISKGVVRNYLGIDYFISLFSSIKLDKLDFKVLNILRLGVFQAVFLSKIPSYSIVNESVDIAKRHTSPGSAKFVNAVLRKITSFENLKIIYENKINEIKNPLEKISICYSFPEWIVKYWIENYQIDKTIKICKALNENPVTYFNINTLKLNTLKSAVEDIYKLIKDKDSSNLSKYFEGRSFSISDDSQNYLKSDFLKDGYIYIQDLSSQIALKYFLDPKENENILDVCCAPGGKAISSSILMNGTGMIYAVDNNKDRMVSVNENLKKMGIKNVRTILADASKNNFLKDNLMVGDCKVKNDYNLKFDKIFIDAPCSALGTSAKNPDVKYNRQPSDIPKLKGNSFKILESCDGYLKVGGKIVFYTCTISPEENKNLIKNFLSIYEKKYKIETVDIAKIFNDVKPGIGEPDIPRTEGFFEIMPYYFKSEGATMCSLIKIS
ncbi:16S rRNA (cytosine(967)-C(5))-methyltransferase RsmB [bacterium]|nr:16S rRNA (cytosine(967)-C(5))-methyltransferase RsmB [bacterium]